MSEKSSYKNSLAIKQQPAEKMVLEDVTLEDVDLSPGGCVKQIGQYCESMVKLFGVLRYFDNEKFRDAQNDLNRMKFETERWYRKTKRWFSAENETGLSKQDCEAILTDNTRDIEEMVDEAFNGEDDEPAENGKTKTYMDKKLSETEIDDLLTDIEKGCEIEDIGMVYDYLIQVAKKNIDDVGDRWKIVELMQMCKGMTVNAIETKMYKEGGQT